MEAECVMIVPYLQQRGAKSASTGRMRMHDGSVAVQVRAGCGWITAAPLAIEGIAK
jgi:hypothetical protein